MFASIMVIILITGICVGAGYAIYMAVTDWIPNYQSNQNSQSSQSSQSTEVYTTPENLTSSSYDAPVLRCPKCGSTDVELHTHTEERKTGCGTILLYIILACTCLGIFILIPMLMRNQEQVVTYAVCNNCGHNWVTSKRK